MKIQHVDVLIYCLPCALAPQMIHHIVRQAIKGTLRGQDCRTQFECPLM